jgi:hypothetical protein
MEGMKLWYVRREVLARNMQDAIKAKGRVFECVLASEKDQPESFTKVKGFKPKTNGQDA